MQQALLVAILSPMPLPAQGLRGAVEEEEMLLSVTKIASRPALRLAVAAVALAATMLVATGEASAWDGRRHHWRPHGGAVAAGVIGGVALGALAAGAFARPHYRSAPVYFAPERVYHRPRCHWEARRVWDGWGWRWGRVRVCERW